MRLTTIKTNQYTGLATSGQNKQTNEQRNKHTYKRKSDLADFFTCIILHYTNEEMYLKSF